MSRSLPPVCVIHQYPGLRPDLTRDRSVVISGDTTYAPELTNLARAPMCGARNNVYAGN